MLDELQGYVGGRQTHHENAGADLRDQELERGRMGQVRSVQACFL